MSPGAGPDLSEKTEIVLPLPKVEPPFSRSPAHNVLCHHLFLA